MHASTPNEASRAFERQWGSRIETFISAGPHVPIAMEADSEKGAVIAEASSFGSSPSRGSPCPPPERGIRKTVELQVLIQQRTHEMVGDVEDGPAFM